MNLVPCLVSKRTREQFQQRQMRDRNSFFLLLFVFMVKYTLPSQKVIWTVPKPVPHQLVFDWQDLYWKSRWQWVPWRGNELPGQTRVLAGWPLTMRTRVNRFPSRGLHFLLWITGPIYYCIKTCNEKSVLEIQISGLPPSPPPRSYFNVSDWDLRIYMFWWTTAHGQDFPGVSPIPTGSHTSQDILYFE